MKTILLASLLFSAVTSFGSTLVIDSITRSVTSRGHLSTPQTATSDSLGAFAGNEQSAGANQTAAVAVQNTILSNDATFTFASQGDFAVIGQRDSTGFAPVTIASESLVEVTFTVPSAAGSASFWVSGSYSIIGSGASPQVSWSLEPRSVGASTGFSSTATSGSNTFDSTGTLDPGQYRLQFKSSLGDGGSQFIGPNQFSSASFQNLNFVASPLNTVAVPEPSSLGLLGLAGWILALRRRRC